MKWSEEPDSPPPPTDGVQEGIQQMISEQKAREAAGLPTSSDAPTKEDVTELLKWIASNSWPLEDLAKEGIDFWEHANDVRWAFILGGIGLVVMFVPGEASPPRLFLLLASAFGGLLGLLVVYLFGPALVIVVWLASIVLLCHRFWNGRCTFISYRSLEGHDREPGLIRPRFLLDKSQDTTGKDRRTPRAKRESFPPVPKPTRYGRSRRGMVTARGPF
jgi:hypothetical protein